MSACCPHSRSANRLFSFFARSYCKRFKQKGLETTQKQLIEELEKHGVENKSILEIGCGVGQLHMALLDKGARSATGVDLSTKMLEEARNWAHERGLAQKTNYLEADFAVTTYDIECADITILDKVLCCYPDANALLKKSTEKTNHILALTYPRFTAINKSIWRMGDIFMWMVGSKFRGYVYNPEAIEKELNLFGFRKQTESVTTIWLTQLYVKN